MTDLSKAKLKKHLPFLANSGSVGEVIFKIIILILIVTLCITLLVPLIWMVLGSMKEYDDFILHTFQWPEAFTFESYKTVWEKLELRVFTDRGTVVYNIVDMFLWSLMYAVLQPLFGLFFTCSMAYVCAKYKTVFTEFIVAYGILLMIIPIMGTLPATMKVYNQLGIYDNMFLMILVGSGGSFSGLQFLMFLAAYKNIPSDYSEAAFLDGAGHFRTYLQIFFPMILPTFVMFYVLAFFGTWNDYGTFLIWLPSYPNLAYGMYMFQHNAAMYGVGMPTILAGFVVVSIPSAILYFVTHDLIAAKFTVGGLKG